VTRKQVGTIRLRNCTEPTRQFGPHRHWAQARAIVASFFTANGVIAVLLGVCGVVDLVMW